MVRLFEWCDGPLVLAMREGAIFLADEISLADDSVLERLNSVLEPERTLVLAEKGSEGDVKIQQSIAQIVAKDGFQLFATMNPGGDYGKKEVCYRFASMAIQYMRNVLRREEICSLKFL